MNWLEVSMTVDGELAEAVADVFARFAPNGVMTEQGVTYNDAEDAGTPSGPITVRAYLEVNDQLEETRQKLEEALFYLGMIRPLPVPSYRHLADQNWMEAWKRHYTPIPIGRRLLILPAWMDSPDSNRIAIKIEPGMAFGTGTHPTTQLCLELMELRLCHPELQDGERSPRRAGDSSLPLVAQNDIKVIDVGCGSGILSIAALKLGAKQALGVDIDEESVKNSRENAEANGVSEGLILGMGSVQEILDGRFAFRSAPLVVANILAPVIVRLFDAGLAELVEAGGAIVLSGILSEQEESVIAAAQAKDLGLTERRQMGDWVALTMIR
ncbi:MAG: 50S ribosomal protein L11 methyltransferase [Chloroflexi bacterium]|nr:50S ribosomal protein L11 methyltransferase [Chloroflexota bacterium]